MPTAHTPEDRWQHLVNGAFLLDEHTRAAPDPAAARAFVESVLEVFTAAIDPIDDFEGYAVRRAALALANALRTGE